MAFGFNGSAQVLRKFEVRGVLAGAYRGKALEDRPILQHYYDVTSGKWGAKRTLCGRIKSDNLCDVAESSDVTCAKCAEKFAKLEAKAEGERGPMVVVISGDAS